MYARIVVIILTIALSVFALPLSGIQTSLEDGPSLGKRHIEPLIGLIETEKVTRDVFRSDAPDEPLIGFKALFKRIIKGGRVGRGDAQKNASDTDLDRRIVRSGRNGRRGSEAGDGVESLETRIIRGGRPDREARDASGSVETLSKRIIRGGRPDRTGQ